MPVDFRRIARSGLRDRALVLGQMPARCLWLAVTGTATDGLRMGIAMTAVPVAAGPAVLRFGRAIWA